MSRSDGKGVEKIGQKAGIHSADSARHLERAQKEEFIVTEGRETGSCKMEHNDD